MFQRTRIEVLRESIKIVVAALSAKKIKVTQHGMSAYVVWNKRTGKPERINIPMIPDNASEKLIKAVQGFVDHECAHCLFTDVEAVKKAKAAGVESLHNIIEDVYIEREMRGLYRGSDANLKEVWGFIAEEMIKPNLDEAIARGNRRAVLAAGLPIAIHAWAGSEAAQDFMADRWDAFKDIRDIIGDDLIDELSEVADSNAAFELAVAVHNRIDEWKRAVERKRREKAEREREASADEDYEEESECAPDDDGDDYESGGEDESDDDDFEDDEDDDDYEDEDDFDDAPGDSERPAEESEDEPDSEEEEGEDDDSEEDERDDESAGSDASEEDEEDEDEDDEPDEDVSGSTSEDMGEDDDEEDEGDHDDDPDESDGDDASDGEKPEEVNEVTGDEDDEEELPDEDFFDDLEEAMKDMDDLEDSAADLIEDEMMEAMGGADYWPMTKDFDDISIYRKRATDETDRRIVQQLEDDVRHHAGALQKKLERSVAARSHARHVPGFRSGKLHGAALFRAKTGDDRVFRRKQIIRTKDVDVQLVVDLSGSMSGPKVRLASEAAYALAQALDRLNINCQVVGFTTKRYHKEAAIVEKEVHSEVREKGTGFHPSRTEPLYMPIFKDWGQRFTSDRKTSLALGRKYIGLYNNIDGESLEYAAHMLAQQQGARKLMIVLSDGEPCAAGDMRQQSRHLKRVVKRLEAAQIEVFGIGIMSEAVNRYYTHRTVLTNLDQLPSTVMTALHKMLLSKGNM